jgi:hypothetical protein
MSVFWLLQHTMPRVPSYAAILRQAKALPANNGLLLFLYQKI